MNKIPEEFVLEIIEGNESGRSAFGPVPVPGPRQDTGH